MFLRWAQILVSSQIIATIAHFQYKFEYKFVSQRHKIDSQWHVYLDAQISIKFIWLKL